MTTNLKLEEIELTDNIKTTFINKLNSNQTKIDNAYGYLKEHLLESTGEHDLASAIEDYKHDFQNIIQPLQQTIAEQEQTIANKDLEIAGKQAIIDGLNSIGNATSNEIASGKTALVQGETITGTYVKKEPIMATITGNTGSQSVTFTFSEDVSDRRIIFFAKPTGTYLRNTSSVQYLMYADSETNTFGALYHSSTSSSYSLLYDRNSYYSITKSGKNVTISGSSSSYFIGGYSSTYTATLYCIAI